MNRFILFFGH